jgi:hypothetical protein
MMPDLHRYLFDASYARVYGRSPELRDFPAELHPDHANLKDALSKGYFDDLSAFRCRTVRYQRSRHIVINIHVACSCPCHSRYRRGQQRRRDAVRRRVIEIPSAYAHPSPVIYRPVW